MRLYIDDIRTPKNEYDKILRNSKETIEFLNNNKCPEFISFDHDLGGEDTSMIIVKWIINKDLDMYEKEKKHYIPESFEFNVHSANPVGTANIICSLKSYLQLIGY